MYHSQSVAKSACSLVGEATQGTNTTEGGGKVSHLVALRVPAGSRGSITTEEDCSRDSIQVVVLWRVCWSVDTHTQYISEC